MKLTLARAKRFVKRAATDSGLLVNIKSAEWLARGCHKDGIFTRFARIEIDHGIKKLVWLDSTGYARVS